MTALFLFNSINVSIMPKINAGITGGFSGTISNVRGYRRNGQSIIQSNPIIKEVTINPSLQQNANRAKFLKKALDTYRQGLVFALNRFYGNATIDWEQVFKDNIAGLDISNPNLLPTIWINPIGTDLVFNASMNNPAVSNSLNSTISKAGKFAKYYPGIYSNQVIWRQQTGSQLVFGTPTTAANYSTGSWAVSSGFKMSIANCILLASGTQPRARSAMSFFAYTRP
jgi:hypothetical protein